jgi:hypothetical protein
MPDPDRQSLGERLIQFLARGCFGGVRGRRLLHRDQAAHPRKDAGQANASHPSASHSTESRRKCASSMSLAAMRDTAARDRGDVRQPLGLRPLRRLAQRSKPDVMRARNPAPRRRRIGWQVRRVDPLVQPILDAIGGGG